MNNNINLIAFGTFGNPNGFRQTFFIGNRELSKSVKTFDLNTSAIKLFPNTNIYAIRKEYAGGHNIISYSAYSFAKEQNSDRGGTFIGSSILFTGKIAEENITLKLLNEFQSTLFNKNVKDNVIAVKHSNDFSVTKPTDFDKTEYHLKSVEDLNFIQSTNKQLVVYCETNPEKLQSFFKNAVDLLNVYDTIYFTDSKEVAEFVYQKNVFTLSQNFEQEIQALHNERKRKIENSISDFDKEIQRLDDDKNKTLNEFKEKIEQNEKLHQENERQIKESKNELEQVKQIYNDFANKIKDLTNQLKSGKKLDDVKKLYNENKRIFIDSVNQIKKPNFVNKIQKPNVNTGLRNNPQLQTGHYNNQHNSERHHRRKSNEIDIVKVISVGLNLLFTIGIVVYLIFFNQDKEIISEPIPPQTVAEQPQPTSDTSQKTLNPIPNGELNENDYRNVAKKVTHSTNVDEVVKTIFNLNPTDIKSSYEGQEEIYKKQLIEKNKDCFEDKNGISYFVKDTLRHIPSYKK